MPTKQDYKQIIEDKLSAESDKKPNKKADVSSTSQENGPEPDVSVTNK
jgi:hypothetical protein